MKRDNNAYGCVGKPRFDAMHTARGAARRVNRGKSTNAAAYSCRRCGGYHVGTSIASRGKLRRPRYEEEGFE